MKALRIGTLVVALSALAVPAHAAVVGLLGGDFDPDAINSGLTYPGGSCDAVNNFFDTSHFNGYQCVFYNFADLDGDEFLDAITSIEFLLSGFIETPDFFVDSFSDLTTLGGDTLVPGSIRLSGGTITPNFNVGCEIECPPLVTGLALYVGPSEGEDALPPLTFQTVVVNGVAAIPEPSTLMLLGSGGVTMLAARRRRGRRA